MKQKQSLLTEKSYMRLKKQILRFVTVGIGATGIDYGIMIALTEIFQINYLISNFVSFSISVVFNYIFSVTWVFNVPKGRKASKDLLVFLVLSIIGLVLNQLLMWVFVDKVHLFYMVAKLFATGVVMSFNFITRKIFLEN